VPLLQFSAGQIYFFGDAWMSSLYLLGFALAIVAGARAQRHAEFADALFFAMVLAAILSVGIALKQWLDVEGLFVWTRELPPGSRPFANLGQPNNLATLVCWGLVGVWRAYLGQKLRGSVAILAALYLLFGVALTQSRTGLLMVISLGAAAALFRTPLQTRRDGLWLVALLVVFVIDLWAMDGLGKALHGDTAGTLPDRLAAGTRLDHWRAMVEAICQRPWLGWGWGQVGVAQQVVAPNLPPVPELIGYSHNLVLDLFVWNGAPIAVLVVLSMVAWGVSTGKRLRTANDAFFYLAIAVLLIHSLLEYPHSYAYFLLPAGLMVGALNSGSVSLLRSAIPRAAIGTAVVLLSASMVWTTVEYFQALTSFTALRFERARVGSGRNSEAPQLVLLTQLRALAVMDRMKITESASTADLEKARMTAERFPAERTLMQYAAMSAGRGDIASARLSLTRLCKLYPRDRCGRAADTWTLWGRGRYPWVSAVTFPVPAK
jgi:O-antigen ligase